MYFVDRKKIASTLQFLNNLIDVSKQKKDWTTSNVDELAFERIVQSAIECVIDVGNSMIDGFIMRDPGSYEDILDILLDEKVIEEAVQQKLLNVVALRKELVRNFIEVNHKNLQTEWFNSLDALEKFKPSVERYLETELGPVSAFLPN